MDRRAFLKSLGAGALSLGAAPALVRCGGNAADRTRFTVVVLPDTQHYADTHPQLFTAQTRWIVENQHRESIAFVSHLGDIVENGPNQRQWQNARVAMRRLDEAAIPYGTCLGNHDLHYSDAEYQYPPDLDHSCSPLEDVDCAAEHYREHFGPQRFASRPWYAGASPSGQSNVQQITIGGRRFVFLHLALDTPAAEIEWAERVLAGMPDAAVHLSTHRYLFDLRTAQSMSFPLNLLTAGRYGHLLYRFDDPLYFDDGLEAEELFQRFVARQTNIFMVHCGHFDAEYRQVSQNDAGLPVHEIVVDFQDSSPKGGDGWLRLMRFDLEADQIRVSTFSPHLGRYRENGEGLDASLHLLAKGVDRLADQLGPAVDGDALCTTIEDWKTTDEGRQQYAEMVYGDGSRDSEFVLDVNFAAYPASLGGDR